MPFDLTLVCVIMFVIKHGVSWSEAARRTLGISWGILETLDPRVLMNVFDHSGRESEAW